MRTYTFTPAQHAVLTHYFVPDVLPLDDVAQTTLGVAVQELEDAEEDLREQGLLVRPPGEDIAVTGELAPLLETIMFPEQLAILRAMLQDRMQPQMYFSFVGKDAACNFVDEQGRHVLSAFDSIEQAIDEILVTSGAHSYQSTNATNQAQPLETLITDCKILTMLMIIDDPAQPNAKACILSWLLARDALWLVDSSAPEEVPTARCVDYPTLHQVVTDTLIFVASARP